jgi:DegV family protein with EDD domain
MDKFDIYVDSSANLTEEMIESNDIKVISYTLTVDGKDVKCYEEGSPYKEIAKNFYDAMRNGCETRTTLLNSQNFIDAVSPSLKAGRDVLLITISSGISGTYHQAQLAAEQIKTLYPERKMLVADSYNASLGEGLFAVQAAKLRDMGQSIEACAQWIDQHKLNMHSEFTVNDLKYLRRGGRISATLAIAGTLLNIKPILRADGVGKMSYSSKERGRKKALAAICQTFADTVVQPENQTVAICHADCEEDALMLADMIREKGANDIIIQWYDICTGSHVGPGTVALFYFGKERSKVSQSKETNPNGMKVKA